MAPSHLHLQKKEDACFTCFSYLRPSWYFVSKKSSSLQFVSNNRSLKISSVSENNRGIYRCVGWAKNDKGNDRPFYADVLLGKKSKHLAELHALLT